MPVNTTRIARAGLLILVALGPACASWRTLHEFPGWSLHARPGVEIDGGAYQRVFEPAFPAVEGLLGPFQRPVRVFAWHEDSDIEPRGPDRIATSNPGSVEEVPGIGPARVRAFHARGDGLFGLQAGVYAGEIETGTAVHELVHARLAEERRNLPLWLEEGVAGLLGDGFLDGDRWVIDGLACWPMRKLSEQELGAGELERLLRLRGGDATDVRENVLVHFVGWAIAFDLLRESGRLEPRAWIERYERGIDPVEARQRISRSVAEETALEWLARLRDPRREVRLAAAKGVWKLRSREATRLLLEALEAETDAEVRVGLAINLLASVGEAPPPDGSMGRLWRSVWSALRAARLGDETEEAALRELGRGSRFRRGRGDSQQALLVLRRFWDE